MFRIILKFMKYKNNHRKIIKEENESQFDDYRVINEEEMEKCMKKKLGELHVQKLSQQLSLDDL